MNMNTREESAKRDGAPAQPHAQPIEGELTLEDLKAVELSLEDLGAVVGGDGAGPIIFGRFNPSNQKTRFRIDR